MGKDQRKAQGRVERVGVSGGRHCGIDSSAVSRARGRDARPESHGGDGAHQVRASRLCDCGVWDWAVQGAFGDEDGLADDVCEALAGADDCFGDFANDVQGVGAVEIRNTEIEARSSKTTRPACRVCDEIAGWKSGRVSARRTVEETALFRNEAATGRWFKLEHN